MALVKSNPIALTEGIAPKVAYPTAGLAILGVVLMALDVAGVIDVEDEIWITLIGSSIGVGGLGYRAPAAVQELRPGTTFTPPAESPPR